jgi:hypothetical protein
MRLTLCIGLASAIAASIAPAVVSAAPLKAAVFEFELVDTSEEGYADGVRADQTGRLADITNQVRQKLKASKVEIVDVAPARKELEDVKAVHDCPSCAQKAAQGLGADLAVVGYVQKVSNLILNINIAITDVKTGKVLRHGSADIRGNNEESWRRGTDYLMKNTILKEPLPEGGAE